MMLRLSAIAALFVTASWMPTVQATADGPDFYAVTGIAAGSSLNLRAGPAEDAAKIDKIAHDARGLQNLGCQGLPSMAEWERMTASKRKASRNHYWCKVRYQGVEGWVAGRFLREDSGSPATVTAGLALSNFKMSCRETGAYQVGVSDDGDIQQEHTAIRETLPLTIEVTLQGGSDSIRIVTINEQVGDLWRKMGGTMEVGVAVNTDQGHWRLDLKKNLLRRVAAIDGRAARFAIFTCERL